MVPLRLKVTRSGFPSYVPLLRRGKLEVHIGEPLIFNDGVTTEEATETIERAVAEL